MPIKLPKDTLDKSTIDTGACTHPAGHCFGSDGGSGIPQNLKVAEGKGGEFQVATLSSDKESIEKLEIYSRCQFCQKYTYVQDKI